MYRLLFWFVAEDRDVLLRPDADRDTPGRGTQKYFSARGCATSALRRVGTAHGDLWQAVRLVLDGLGDEDGLPQLGLPGLGGIYDDTGTDQILHGLELSNEHLLAAVKSLARVHDKSARRWRRVDYRNLGAEELGSIYESLLELVAEVEQGEREFLLDVMPGNERKSTGSYYTPTSLIDCLLDSTLDPVLDDARSAPRSRRPPRAPTRRPRSPRPCCRSRSATRPAAPATSSSPPPAASPSASPPSASTTRNPPSKRCAPPCATWSTHCIYGVDVNPMAVELAKVSLWLEALEPGKPLGFLDAHIKCGNALIGATPALIDERHPRQGVQARRGRRPRSGPRRLRRANANDRAGRRTSCSATSSSSRSPTRTSPRSWPGSPTRRTARCATCTARPPPTATGKSRRRTSAHRQVADAWCAAFVWLKTKDAPPAIVNRVFRALQRAGHAGDPAGHRHRDRAAQAPSTASSTGTWSSPTSSASPTTPTRTWTRPPAGPAASPASSATRRGTRSTSRTRSTSAWSSRPSPRSPGRRGAPASPSGSEENPEEGARYRAARRKVKATFLFASSSGAFPLCAKGLTVKGVNSLQTDQLFAERFAAIAAPVGRVGCIIPTAIATGAGGQYLFRDFTERGAVASLYDFENQASRSSPGCTPATSSACSP